MGGVGKWPLWCRDVARCDHRGIDLVGGRVGDTQVSTDLLRRPHDRALLMASVVTASACSARCPGQRALQVHARGEEPLDDVVMQVMRNAFPLRNDGQQSRM